MSDFLFAQAFALSGAARVLDLLALFDFYNVSPTGEEADGRATFADWRAVGNDIFESMPREEGVLTVDEWAE